MIDTLSSNGFNREVCLSQVLSGLFRFAREEYVGGHNMLFLVPNMVIVPSHWPQYSPHQTIFADGYSEHR
ncbi:MAG: hypothetical protein OXC02_02870 [Rhodobacteraceae bacterium]|nr:hypothetical protein [Paracoccaceae bacterium]